MDLLLKSLSVVSLDLHMLFGFYIIQNYMVKFLVPSNLVLSETVIVVLSSIPFFIDLYQQCSATYIPLRFWVWLLLHRCCLSQQLVQIFSVCSMSAIVKNSKMVISSSRNKCIFSVKFLQVRTMKWDKLKDLPEINTCVQGESDTAISMSILSGPHCQCRAEPEQVQQLLKLGE